MIVSNQISIAYSQMVGNGAISVTGREQLGSVMHSGNGGRISLSEFLIHLHALLSGSLPLYNCGFGGWGCYIACW